MGFVNWVIHFGKLIRMDAVGNDDDPFKDLNSGIVQSICAAPMSVLIICMGTAEGPCGSKNDE